MRKEAHISEFSAKKGDGLHVRVTTSRYGKRVSIDGGRFYYQDYVSKAECMRYAKKARDKIIDDIANGSASTVPTLREVYDQSYELFPVADPTKRKFDTLFESLNDIGNVKFTRITLADVQMSVSKFVHDHSQDRTRRFVSLWARIYKTAMFLEINVPDYSRLIVVPKSKVITKKRNTEMSYQTFMDAIAIFSRARSFYGHTAMKVAWLMYFTGARITEVLGLSVGDIDREKRVIHFRKAVASDKPEITPLKTDGSDRIVPIAPGLDPILTSIMKGAKHDLLICYDDGSPIPSAKLTAYVNCTCRLNNVPFTLYKLRHLFSADLFRQGVNPKVIQSLMGHASADMSAYYAFTTEEEKAEAIKNRI